MPKISVIIPVFNVEKYLDRCVQSVINQTLKDIEIILVDDESPDNCPQMCDEYAKKDLRIKVVHKKNGGLGFARNSGLEVATGEYVTFLDSDDYIDIKMCEITYNKALNNNLDICSFSYYRFDDNNCLLAAKNSNEEKIFDGKNEIKEYMLNLVGPKISTSSFEKYSISACHAIFKRKIFIDNNIRFRSERELASEDLVFNLDYIPFTNRIGYIPQKLYYYYFNQNSLTSNYSEAKYYRLIKLLEYVNEKLSSMFEYEIYKEHYFYQILRIYKVIMKYESKKRVSLIQRMKRIKQECNSDILKSLYKDACINKTSNMNRIFIFCMKHSLSLPIIAMYTLLKK